MFSKRKDVIANITSSAQAARLPFALFTMPVNGQAATARKNGNPVLSRKGQIQR